MSINHYQLTVFKDMCDFYSLYQRQQIDLGLHLLKGAQIDQSSHHALLNQQNNVDFTSTYKKVEALATVALNASSTTIAPFTDEEHRTLYRIGALYETEMLHILRRAVPNDENQAKLLKTQKDRFDYQMNAFRELEKEVLTITRTLNPVAPTTPATRLKF